MARIEDYPLTLKDVANKLGMSCNAIRRLVAASKLRAERFGPLRELRFREEDIDNLVANVDPAELHRKIVLKIKDVESYYQNLMTLPLK
jgi:excisionase family DNA binding protein